VLKYTYPNANAIRIQVSAFGGLVTNRIVCIFENSRLKEYSIYDFNNINLPVPTDKFLFTYNAAGNITKQEVFEFINNTWVKAQDIIVTAYDTKPNLSANYEDVPFLLETKLLTNNPLSVEYKWPNGQLNKKMNYTYTYNTNGNKTTAKIVTQTNGIPDIIENRKYLYK
jgi:hypothetical protein